MGSSRERIFPREFRRGALLLVALREKIQPRDGSILRRAERESFLQRPRARRSQTPPVVMIHQSREIFRDASSFAPPPRVRRGRAERLERRADDAPPSRARRAPSYEPSPPAAATRPDRPPTRPDRPPPPQLAGAPDAHARTRRFHSSAWSSGRTAGGGARGRRHGSPPSFAPWKYTRCRNDAATPRASSSAPSSSESASASASERRNGAVMSLA